MVIPQPSQIALSVHTRSFARVSLLLSVALLFVLCASNTFTVRAQEVPSSKKSALTPQQQELERERQRLASADQEERREAVTRLGAMKRAEASRVAATALSDSSPIVRATVARSILSLTNEEAANLLLPLLQDKEEFVRREAAYALGLTRSRTAVPSLVSTLEKDKEASVRSAAAIALGEIGDESAVLPLTQTFTRRVKVSSGFLRRKKQEPENEFVRRAAAHSLGQIKSRAGVPALIALLSDEKSGDDVRREAARSLGLIGDLSAVSALRAALTSHDPYLSRIAYEALRKISPADATRPS
ncbi:MAG: HEAT repeat domain-containing protein [Pyrinomonadaceae bacterium]